MFEASLTWQKDTLQPQANALATNVFNNATEAATSATTAGTQATSAAGYATAAQTSANDALAQANAAAANANAPLWVSGTTYGLNAVAYSPTNGRTYRRIIAGAGTTDPISDGTNWRALLLDISTFLPAIRPTLLVDFANSLAVDPRITFSRASAATQVNKFGLLELVASGASRIDYDPVTLACRGFLVEEARTNLVLNSVLAGTSLATQSVTVTAVPHTLSFYGTGTVTLSGTSSGSLVGSGAYPTRSTLTFTPTAGSLTLTVTGSVQFAQLEVGAFASSFIPTAGATATRAADVAVMTGTSFTGWFSANEGTFVTQTDTTAPASGGYVYSADRGSAGPRLQLNWSSTTVQNAAVVDDASALVVSLTGTGGSNAFAYKLNDFAMAASGTISTDTVGGVPSALTRLVIGASPSGVSQLNGHIRSIAYYPKRLTNTELQALSTL